MEYGLWNFHGGFWTGGNSGFPPAEGVSRNFYTTVNNEIEPTTFHVSTPGKVYSSLKKEFCSSRSVQKKLALLYHKSQFVFTIGFCLTENAECYHCFMKLSKKLF